MTSAPLAIQDSDSLPLARQVFGNERLAVLKQQIAPGASDAELELFAAVCRRTGLDPFARQIYSIRRRRKAKDHRGQWVWEEYQTTHVGIDGLRLIAARSREYAGQLGPQWLDKDNRWHDVWTASEPPVAARVGVRRKGFPEPIWSTAVWDRAVQVDGEGNPTSMWKRLGPEMLAKVAEANALKRAFPAETQGVEMIDEQELARQRQVAEQDSDRYVEIFGTDEDHDGDGVPMRQTVNTTTGEVEDRAASSLPLESAPEGRAGESPSSARRPSRPDLWAENRRLVEEARKRGIQGPTLNARIGEDALEAANSELATRIENHDLDQVAAKQAAF